MPRYPATDEAARAAYDRLQVALAAYRAKNHQPSAQVLSFAAGAHTRATSRISEADRECVAGGLNKLAETIDWLDDCLPKPLLAKLQAVHAEIAAYREEIS